MERQQYQNGHIRQCIYILVCLWPGQHRICDLSIICRLSAGFAVEEKENERAALSIALSRSLPFPLGCG